MRDWNCSEVLSGLSDSSCLLWAYVTRTWGSRLQGTWGLEAWSPGGQGAQGTSTAGAGIRPEGRREPAVEPRPVWVLWGWAADPRASRVPLGVCRPGSSRPDPPLDLGARGPGPPSCQRPMLLALSPHSPQRSPAQTCLHPTS